jgi:hypothetical protein
MYIGVVPDVTAVEVPYWELDPSSVAVVLLVCKGVLTLDEAVNCTRLPADHLIHEAQSWAVAESMWS